MALKACPECKKEISTAASRCPHCGRPLRTGLYSAVKALVFFGGLVVIFVGIIGTQSSTTPTETAQQRLAKYRAAPIEPPAGLHLEVLTNQVVDGYLTAVITNTADRAIVRARFTFGQIDRFGGEIGECTDEIESLPAHGVWNFKCFVTQGAAVRFKEKDRLAFFK
jgi:hypothetical protein